MQKEIVTYLVLNTKENVSEIHMNNQCAINIIQIRFGSDSINAPTEYRHALLDTKTWKNCSFISN